jgi:hypothetical protein
MMIKMIKLQVHVGGRDRIFAAKSVKRGEVLGLSPYFDDHVVLSPIDGVIERIEYDPWCRVALLSIREHGSAWRPVTV